MPIIGTIASSRRVAGAADTGSIFPLGTVIVPSGGQANITFSSIPATYKHLQIRGIMRSRTAGAGNNSGLYMRFNGVSTGNLYDIHILAGAGSTPVHVGAYNQNEMYINSTVPRAGDLANCYAPVICDILDYTSTTKNKTCRILAGDDINSVAAAHIRSGQFRSTSAISSIALILEGDFEQFSTLSLYGVKG